MKNIKLFESFDDTIGKVDDIAGYIPDRVGEIN